MNECTLAITGKNGKCCGTDEFNYRQTSPEIQLLQRSALPSGRHSARRWRIVREDYP